LSVLRGGLWHHHLHHGRPRQECHRTGRPCRGRPDHPTNAARFVPRFFAPTRDYERPAATETASSPPGATDWQDISWDDAINEIAARIKKTRDDTFVEKDAAGHTVNRLESLAFIGGCTDTNEFNYLAVKAMRALGVVHLENQARV